MNILKALCESINDKELEFLYAGRWYTKGEFFGAHGSETVGVLYSIQSEVRKRQSPIDACVKEVLAVGDQNTLQAYNNLVKKIIQKHWPKEK